MYINFARYLLAFQTSLKLTRELYERKGEYRTHFYQDPSFPYIRKKKERERDGLRVKVSVYAKKKKKKKKGGKKRRVEYFSDS